MASTRQPIKNVCFVAILNHNDEPIYTVNYDKDTEDFEQELIAFSSLDHFDVVEVKDKNEHSGGQLCCNIINDDMFYAYGFHYGTRIKVIIILKNHQVNETAEVAKCARLVHEIYSRDRLNPFKLPEKVSHSFDSRIKKNQEKVLIQIST